jgi:transcription termination factor NusB
VAIAKELSTEDSGRFVNGILGEIAREVEPGAHEPRSGG